MINSGFMAFLVLATILPVLLYVLPRVFGKSPTKKSVEASTSVEKDSMVADKENIAIEPDMYHQDNAPLALINLMKLFFALIPVVILLSLWAVYILVHGYVEMSHGLFLSASLVCMAVFVLYVKPVQLFRTLLGSETGDLKQTKKHKQTNEGEQNS